MTIFACSMRNGLSSPRRRNGYLARERRLGVAWVPGDERSVLMTVNHADRSRAPRRCTFAARSQGAGRTDLGSQAPSSDENSARVLQATPN